MNIIYPIPGFSEPFSSITHLLGALIFFAIGIYVLKDLRGSKVRSLSMLIYIFAVVFLLAISGVFHLLTPGTGGRYVLQVLDHAAIFLLIAATFTPIHLLHFRGFMRWGILTVVWVTAITGVTLKSVFFQDVPEILSLLLYLGLGWLGVLTAYFLYQRMGLRAITALILGALAYTLGATMEFTRFPNLIPGVIGPHETFHILVIAGIGFHWRFVHRLAMMHKLDIR